MNRIVMIGIAVLFASSARAATLTWEASVQEAAQNNAPLQAARHSWRAAIYDERGAYSGFLPQMSADLNYNYGNSGNGRSNDATYTASLSATQNFFSGFKDKGKVDQAHANRVGAAASLDRVRAQASYDLKSAFSAMLYAQNSIALTADIMHRREDNLRLVELRFESGLENKGSYLLSKAYLAQAELDHFQATNTLLSAKPEFARVLGRNESQNESEDIAVSGSVPVKPPPEAVDLNRLVVEIPDYRQALAQEEAAQAAKIIARAPFFPVINGTASAQKNGSDWFPSNESWNLGASISLPFFSGGKDLHATLSALEAWRAASFTRDNTQRAGLVKLQQTYLGYQEAERRLQVDRAFVEAAQARAQIARQKYNNGLLSFEDWDIIENDLIARQKSLLATERDRVVAEAAWEQAQGKAVIP